MTMKWYFSITEDTLTADEDHGFLDMIRVAVASAQINTSLRPHLLYDGNESAFTDEMRAAGVTVIRHRISFYDQLQRAQQRLRPDWPDYMRTAAGAFQRLDIPNIETKEEFVLYTDCDVMFLSDPAMDNFRPATFAVASQFDLYGHHKEINSGVMLMNVRRLRADLPAMLDFACDMLHTLHGYDQEFLRVFYNGKWDPLSPKYNWKPYWGVDPMARVVHFHGPKPAAAHKLIKDKTYRQDDPVFQAWRNLFFKNPDAYRFYVDLWRRFKLSPAQARRAVPSAARDRASLWIS